MAIKFYSANDGKWHDAIEADKIGPSEGGKTYINGYPSGSPYVGSLQLSGQTSFTSSYVECKEQHEGYKDLLTINGMVIAAAEKQHIGEFDHDTLLVNLMGTRVTEAPRPPSTPVKETPPRMEMMLSTELAIQHEPTYHGEEMMVEWQDGGTPMLKPAFWGELVNKASAAGYKRLIVMCFGAHGRTGTALCSIMLAFGFAENTDDAIAWVRKHHCKRAVETDKQIDYLDYLSASLYNWERPKGKQRPKASR